MNRPKLSKCFGVLAFGVSAFVLSIAHADHEDPYDIDYGQSSMHGGGCPPVKCAYDGLVLKAQTAEDLQSALLAGGGINVRQKYTADTILHLVAREGRDISLEFLLKHGADLHAINRDREVPIQCALKSANVPFVRELLMLSADESSKSLIPYIIDVSYIVNKTFGYGRKAEKALHTALRSSSPHRNEMVKLLLDYGADPFKKDAEHIDGMLIALGLFDPELDALFGIERSPLDSSEDCLSWDSEILIQTIDIPGMEDIDTLVAWGAGVNVRKPGTQSTPAHLSASYLQFDDDQTMYELMNFNPDLSAKDDAGYTPIHLAAMHGHAYQLDAMFSHYLFGESAQAHINLVHESTGKSALDFANEAPENTREKTIEVLLKYGATSFVSAHKVGDEL